MNYDQLKRRLLYTFTILTTVIYLVWRGIYTLPWNESIFALVFGCLLWLSEICSNFTAILLIWSKGQAKPLEKPSVCSEDYPDVDVLIATHNEDSVLLTKTINSALRMKYPDTSKVHIYLADDNERPEIAALAAKFSIGYLGVKNNKHAKSGNFNYALAHTHSPLVATFDADMIPYADFLMETVPYFIDNQNRIQKNNENIKPLGLVQTPQSFYNADLFQFNLFSEGDIPNEQDFFSREVNVYNSAHGAAIYTGSNTVISRQAIIDAGGFPTNTITEDFQLGAQINMAGYQNISTLEPMASGLTPSDIPSILKQRVRWGRGVVQSIYNIRAFTNPKLTFAQRLVYLNGFLYWWSFFRRLLYIFAPILFTVFNIRVVDTDFWLLLAFWLPSYVLIQFVMADISSDLRTSRWGEIQETIFAPYLVIPIFLQTIGFKETKFKVTNKDAKQSNKDLLYVLPHAIMLLLAVYGVITFNYGKFGSEIAYGSVITFWLLSHIVNLTFACLYYLGRPAYRQSERFAMTNDITVTDATETYHFVTHDISETGLSFVADAPYYFNPDENLAIIIRKKDEVANLKGKIVRVWQMNDQYYYGITLEDIADRNEADHLNYLQIIYDGFNQSLRQTMDPMVTMIDSFLINFQRRQNLSKKPNHTSEVYPKIQVNQSIVLAEGQVYVYWTNYQTIALDKKDITHLQIGEVNLQLNRMDKTDSHQYTYQIENLDQVMAIPRMKALFHEWLMRTKNKQKPVEEASL